MSRYVIAVSKEFHQWAGERTKFQGIGKTRWLTSSTLEELADAIMAFTELHRWKSEIDRLTPECSRVIESRESRRNWQRIDRMSHERTFAGKPYKSSYQQLVTPQFKIWFDETKRALEEATGVSITRKEIADALMFFVERYRYTNNGDDLFAEEFSNVFNDRHLRDLNRKAIQYIDSLNVTDLQ